MPSTPVRTGTAEQLQADLGVIPEMSGVKKVQLSNYFADSSVLDKKDSELSD